MKIKLLVLLILAFVFSFSQNDSTGNSRFRFISLIYENDLFAQTDRYYTQGIHLKLAAPFFRYSPFSKLLYKGNAGQNSYGIAFEQDCFTPKSILDDSLNRMDRPYAGSLIISHFNISVFNQHRIESNFDAGIIGPCAQCEEEQKAIHRATDNAEPLGWRYQLSQDLILNYSFLYEPVLFTSNYLEAFSAAKIRMGTLHTDAGLGVHLRTGLMNSYCLSNRNKKNTGNKMQLFLTTKAGARAVAYNALLQGGLFTDSPHGLRADKLSRVVFYSSLGITFSYKNLFLEFSENYISKEFTSGLDHAWGHCNLTCYF